MRAGSCILRSCRADTYFRWACVLTPRGRLRAGERVAAVFCRRRVCSCMSRSLWRLAASVKAEVSAVVCGKTNWACERISGRARRNDTFYALAFLLIPCGHLVACEQVSIVGMMESGIRV